MLCPFLTRLGRYGFDPDTLEKVQHALGEPVGVEKGARLCAEGVVPDSILFVDEGWLTARDQLNDGSAFYRALYMPGDIAGLGELAWAPASSDIVALTPGAVRRLGRAELDALLSAQSGVATLLFTMSVVQQTSLADRHAHALKSDGRGRLLYFLLDLHERQSLVREDDWLDLPLTQTEIANAVGLSNVHVNVLLRSLAEEGLVAREGRRLHLADVPALSEEVGFRPRWREVDFSWMRGFPASGAHFAA